MGRAVEKPAMTSARRSNLAIDEALKRGWSLTGFNVCEGGWVKASGRNERNQQMSACFLHEGGSLVGLVVRVEGEYQVLLHAPGGSARHPALSSQW